jgi:hypothetical protein
LTKLARRRATIWNRATGLDRDSSSGIVGWLATS